MKKSYQATSKPNVTKRWTFLKFCAPKRAKMTIIYKFFCHHKNIKLKLLSYFFSFLLLTSFVLKWHSTSSLFPESCLLKDGQFYNYAVSDIEPNCSFPLDFQTFCFGNGSLLANFIFIKRSPAFNEREKSHTQKKKIFLRKIVV